MSDIKRAVFVTGGTGLVGSYLIKELLDQGNKVYALARSINNQLPDERVARALEFWYGSNFPLGKRRNLHVMEGDITLDFLGLSKKNRETLVADVSEIFHCAAIVKFNARAEKLRAVNVLGLRNVLELGMQCCRDGKFKKVNHISTAFICGDYNGDFNESSFDVGQKLVSPYVQSKFEAEKLLRQYRNAGLWVDIFRPCAIIGESSTGKLPSRNHLLLQVLSLQKKGILDYWPQGLFLKAVFVDELCRCVLRLSEGNARLNQTYHPFPSYAICLDDLFAVGIKYYGIKKPRFMPLDEFLSKVSAVQKAALRYNVLYMNQKVLLNSRETIKVAADSGFQFVPLTEKHMERIYAYYMDLTRE